MATPATTGQLRTKTQDMQIGDYIACGYKATANTIGEFNNLGMATGSEIPITGVSAPDGFFYLIKVDTGLLIADRVIQNSITWDVLNNSRVMQGGPMAGNIVKLVKTVSEANGIVTASFSGADGEAWKAFNGIATNWQDRWYVNTFSSGAWIQYKFDTSKKVEHYSIVSVNEALGANRAPKNWTFEASNDGANWVVLDSRTNITWSAAGIELLFNVTQNKGVYQYYKLVISANNGDSAMEIAELRMFDIPYGVRSLTGGVAYADANGGMSTTNQNFGGWPTNNEWDKYIINFPKSKMQVGKTTDDIFHWSGNVVTLCQETPAIGITQLTSTVKAVSSHRVHRGSFIQNNDTALAYAFSFISSNSAASNVGFRPVFEYKEV
ncbi:hypothetical protein M2277_004928 [Paenibacillus sp. LBL]|uniref:hypothetical protein n=1 Tax=Paenibacillus sp. LBL TaxID=2940563 RepID=UPI00247676EE|nr:hypothetical protein [Paenibacillus sp. LBL]MDH6674236.1 hypothetical protein [Paenibacillus sp. LBL]